MQQKDLNQNFRKYYNYNDAGSGFFWALISPYVVLIFALLIAMIVCSQMGIDVKQIPSMQGFVIATSILTPLSFLAVFLIYNKAKKISFSASCVKFNLSIKTILVLVAISFVCVFGLQYFISGIDEGLKSIGFSSSGTMLPLTNGWWYVLNLFVLALLPAVCEELVFRGIIFNGLRKNLGNVSAIIVSAILFALMHASLEQLVYPLILGAIFGLIVLRTGNVLCSMIVHFLNNAIVITLAFVAEKTGFDFMPSSKLLFWILAIGLMIVTFAILFVIDRFYFRKKIVKDEETVYSKTSEEKFPFVIFIVSLFIAKALFVVNAINSF